MPPDKPILSVPQHPPLGTATATTASGPSLNLVAPPSLSVSATERRPGYEYDPYDSPGERAEGMFVGRWIGKITGDPDGFCSTSREWHIMWNGISDGLSAKTMDDFPKCPPLWIDEKPYYEGPGKLVNIIKCQWPTVVTLIMGYGGLKVAGIA
jgi:hypothetical protein